MSTKAAQGSLTFPSLDIFSHIPLFIFISLSARILQESLLAKDKKGREGQKGARILSPNTALPATPPSITPAISCAATSPHLPVWQLGYARQSIIV